MASHEELDLHGDVYFPFQVLTILSRPGVDFEGGELVLVEQRPRAQRVGPTSSIPRRAHSSSSRPTIGRPSANGGTTAAACGTGSAPCTAARGRHSGSSSTTPGERAAIRVGRERVRAVGRNVLESCGGCAGRASAASRFRPPERPRGLNDFEFSNRDRDAIRSRRATAAEREGLLDVAIEHHDPPLGPLTLATTDTGLVRLGLPVEDDEDLIEAR